MPKKEATKKTINTNTGAEEKQKALQTAIAHIEKQFGAGAVMYMSGEHSKMNVESLPTGSLTLDIALGIGGLPKGRITEIYGPESGGKTTVSLHAVAEAQKKGGIAAFIDVEHALDPIYAKALGVDVEQLIVSQPDTGEQALEIIEALTRSGAVDIIVLDSVAAMTTKAEIEGEMGSAIVGMQARLMSSSLRKLTSVISKTNTVAIFINQIREKIGGYGNPETTPGGRALKFYASVRIEVRKSEPIKNGTEIVGARTKCKVQKNKVAPPFKSCEFDMIFGKGISKDGEILDIATEIGVTRKSGAWFYYGDERLGQGRENSKEFLSQNPDLMSEIEQKVREQAEKVNVSAAEDDDNSPAASDEPPPLNESPPAPAKKSKKTVIVEADDNFEEFSPDDL
ncbi:MAG: recombinase RecA [Oscillospiraceae bacterium]|jgi:recombination protein RecA|nr:recombinase RecA [Oscillospiraceae bacterium]